MQYNAIYSIARNSAIILLSFLELTDKTMGDLMGGKEVVEEGLDSPSEEGVGRLLFCPLLLWLLFLLSLLLVNKENKILRKVIVTDVNTAVTCIISLLKGL